MPIHALSLRNRTTHSFANANTAADFTGDTADEIANWLRTKSASAKTPWRYAKPKTKFPSGPFPIACKETNKLFFSDRELTVAGFDPAWVMLALYTKIPVVNRQNGELLHFHFEEQQPCQSEP